MLNLQIRFRNPTNGSFVGVAAPKRLGGLGGFYGGPLPMAAL